MTIQARFRLSYTKNPGNQFTLDVDLNLPSSGVTAIFGHSGSGKSSLLRCIAGLESAQEAHLVIDDNVWQSVEHSTPAHQRPIAYVFQEASLFVHLSVAKNLAYAVKRADTRQILSSYDEVVDLMQLRPILNNYPEHLSGGERQRVAIARALLIQPRLLLMDEPLASLDSQRKQDILPYLERLRAQFSIPILYVSHSIDEVARLADQVVVLDQGRVAAQGHISDVFSRLELSHLLAEQSGVILEGDITEHDKQWNLSRFTFDGGNIWIADEIAETDHQVRLRVLARDVSLALEKSVDSSILNRLSGTIIEIANDPQPALCLVRIKVGKAVLLARITRRSVAQLQLSEGSSVYAQIKSAAIVR